jgi:hypothetical protein
METKDTCLYIHTRKDDGGIFYVGIGDENRPYVNKKRNNYWNNVVKKYEGFEVTILKTDMTWKEACDLEIKMIAFYGRVKPSKKNLNYGCLVNMTDGGEGSKGRIFSEKTIKKMSESRIGKITSEDTKKKLSKKLIGRIISDDTKLKMSQNHANVSGKNHPQVRKVICNITGKIYECIQDAADDIGVNRNTLKGYLRGNNPNKTSIRYI